MKQPVHGTCPSARWTPLATNTSGFLRTHQRIAATYTLTLQLETQACATNSLAVGSICPQAIVDLFELTIGFCGFMQTAHRFGPKSLTYFTRLPR